MRVVVDMRPLQQGFKAHATRGIGRYTRNLVHALERLLPPGQPEALLQENLGVVPEAEGRRVWWAPAAPGGLPTGKRLLTLYGLVYRALVPIWASGGIVHIMAHIDAPMIIHGRRSVLTVHDLIPRRFAHLYRRGRLWDVQQWVETRALYQAARLIAVSRTTKRDLVELMGISPAKVRVIPEAADPHLRPPTTEEIARARKECGLEDVQYFLYLGGIDQRKGLGVLLKAMAALQGRAVLAVAGEIRSDRNFPAMMAMVQALGLEGKVRLLGYVEDKLLPGLMGGAVAFVFPSLYEGFGLPPLEAMACATPVVAAGGGAVEEVVGEAGVLVPPGDELALARAMGRILDNPSLRRELARRGLERAKSFSWEAAAEASMRVYEELLK